MEKRVTKIYRALAAGIIERDEVLLKLNIFCFLRQYHVAQCHLQYVPFIMTTLLVIPSIPRGYL